MRQQTCRHIYAYLLMTVFAAALLGCGGSPSGESPVAEPGPITRTGSRRGGPSAGTRGASSQQHLAQLGITGKPNAGEPQGLLVTGFVASSETAPLAVIGVKEGDVIVSCNGQHQQLGVHLVAAVKALQENGEPLTLVVAREGEQVTLERSEKLPGSQTGQNPK